MSKNKICFKCAHRYACQMWNEENILTINIDACPNRSVAEGAAKKPSRFNKDEREVLSAYAQANMNIGKAAQLLHMHRNTVSWRLNAVYRNYKLDPHNFFDLCEIISEIINTEV